MINQGWIKLHRKLLNWQWYSSTNHTRLFLHLLLTANHKDNYWKKVLVKKGQKLTSYDSLSKETGLSRQQCRSIIKDLIETHEITHKGYTKYSIITINNWNMFQNDNTQSNTQITCNQHTNNIQITSNKNDNNEKNVKKEYDDYPDFVSFWKNYKRGSKKQAFDEYLKIRNNFPIDIILKHIPIYRKECKEDQFMQHGCRYIKNRIWESYEEKIKEKETKLFERKEIPLPEVDYEC